MIHALEVKIKQQDFLLVPEDVSEWEEKIDKELFKAPSLLKEPGELYYASIPLPGISDETFLSLFRMYESNGWKCIPSRKNQVRILNFVPKDEYRKSLKIALIILASLFSVVGLAIVVFGLILKLG